MWVPQLQGRPDCLWKTRQQGRPAPRPV